MGTCSLLVADEVEGCGVVGFFRRKLVKMLRMMVNGSGVDASERLFGIEVPDDMLASKGRCDEVGGEAGMKWDLHAGGLNM
jgi:hypothetical protein